MLIVWVFLGLSVLTGAGLLIFLKIQQKGAGAGASSKPGSLKDYWEIQDIQRGVVRLTGDRYRMICRLAAKDYYLLSAAEQDALEDTLAAALRGLDFPVQTLVLAETLDTRGTVAALRESALGLSGKIREHALARAEYLESIRQGREVSAQTAYIVIPANASSFEEANMELSARVNSLAQALSPAGIRLEALDTGGAADLLSHLLSPHRAWNPSDAGERGIMSLYHKKGENENV